MKSSRPPPRRARVLAVDDEPALVDAYRRMMRRTHDVVPASSGLAALGILETDASFDVIVCDVSMPGMSGAELYTEVERRFPALARRFVFLTGGTSDPVVVQSGAPCLDKPVDFAALAVAIAGRLTAG